MPPVISATEFRTNAEGPHFLLELPISKPQPLITKNGEERSGQAAAVVLY